MVSVHQYTPVAPAPLDSSRTHTSPSQLLPESFYHYASIMDVKLSSRRVESRPCGMLPRGLSICFAPDVLVNVANPQTPPHIQPRNLSLPIKALSVYSNCLQEYLKAN